MVFATDIVHHRGPVGIRRLVNQHHIIMPKDDGVAGSAIFDGHGVSGAERWRFRGNIRDAAAMGAGRAVW